jgi:hypothetical protein
MAYSLKAAAHTIATIAQATHRAFARFDEDTAHTAYLDGATDRIDLELRMRELDRPTRRTLAGYPNNFSIH